MSAQPKNYPKSYPETAALLLEGLRCGALELVAETKLTGHPFDNLNKPPEAVDKAFYSLYCYDESWIPKIEGRQLVARGRSTGFSELPDGRRAARYKLHGDFEKALVGGITLPDRDHELMLKYEGEKKPPRIDLVNNELKGSRKSRRFDTLSNVAFGPNRLFMPLSKELIRNTYQLALAKAEEIDGMSDVLIIRSRRNQDNVLAALEDVGLYRGTTPSRKAAPRFECANHDADGRICALYIPAEMAASIRAAKDNGVIEFAFESPDTAALTDAINNHLTEDTLRFVDGEASVETVGKLAARYWPEVPEKIVPRLVKEEAKAPVTWRKPMFLLLREAKIEPKHYTIIKTCQADGGYNYRLQVNDDAAISKQDLWVVADTTKCKDPLRFDKINFRDELPRRLRIAPDGSETEALKEIANLEKAIGSRIAVEEIPFQLQVRGVQMQDVVSVMEGRRHTNRMAITGLEVATIRTEAGVQHYLVLAAPHAQRLSEVHLRDLGLRKQMKAMPLTKNNESPALVAVPIVPLVAEHILKQKEQSEPLRRVMSLQADEPQADMQALTDHLRSKYKVAAIETRESDLVVINRKLGAGASGAADKNDKAFDPTDDALRIINKYPLRNLVLQRVPTKDGAHLCLSVLHQSDNHNFNALKSTLERIVEEDGSREMDDEDIRLQPGIDNRHLMLQLDYLPDDLGEALLSGSRTIAVIDATSEDPQEIAAQARDHFRRLRQKSSGPEAPGDERSLVAQLASKPIAQLKVRYPDLQEWADYRREFDGLISYARRWADTLPPAKDVHDQAIAFAEQMKPISPAAHTMLQSVLAASGGASSIRHGLESAHQAEKDIAAEEAWRGKHLDADHTVRTLVLRDAGKRSQHMIDQLQATGRLTKPPVYLDYQRLSEGKRRKRKKAQACVLYLSEETWRELDAEHEASYARQVPSFGIEAAVDAGELSDLVKEQLDVDAIERRQELEQRPTKALQEMNTFIRSEMLGQALLIRERSENLIDGKTGERGKAVQGVGADKSDKGSQLTLVAALDGRNMKSFLRQVVGPLLEAKLLAGQKIYEEKTVRKPRALSPVESELVALKALDTGLRSYAEPWDMGYRISPIFAQQLERDASLRASLIEPLKEELSLAIRIYERLADKDAALFQAVTEWAKAPDAGTLPQNCPPMLIWPALLCRHGLSRKALDEGADPLPAFRSAVADYQVLQTGIYQLMGDKEEQAAIDRRDIRTDDEVLGVSRGAAALYTLDGKPIDAESLIKESGPVIVKCYLSAEAEALSSRTEGSPLRALKDALSRQIEARGRRDVAVGDDDKAAVGEHTARIRSESDLVRRVRYAATDDHAITAKEAGELMSKYFESGRRISH